MKPIDFTVFDQIVCRFGLTKFWFFTGMLAITVMYVWNIMHSGQFENDTLVYAPLVGGTHIANIIAKLKYGDPNHAAAAS